MRTRLTGIATVLALTGAFVLAGCKEEGSGEKAGKELDKAADEAAETMEDAGEELEKEAEEGLGKAFDTGGG